MSRVWNHAPTLTRVLLVAAAIVGIALRLLWLHHEPGNRVPVGEAENVAISIAHSGVFGDPFRIGQGPTAHLTPITPGLSGLVYRKFGVASPASNTILTAWSLSVVFASFTVLYLVFAQLGSPRVARVAALVTLFVFPLNFGLEVIWFRFWDSALVALLAGLVLLCVLDLDRRQIIRTRDICLFSLLASLLFFMNPACGLAAYASAALLLVSREFPRRIAGFAVLGVAIQLAVLVPWTIRNILVMHEPIVSRDNAGLELALANYPRAVTDTNARVEHRRRWHEIHPFASPAAYERLVATGGEAEYSRRLGKEATSWIMSHPGDFLALSARHLAELMFPPDWYWSFNEDKPHKDVGLKRVANDVFSVLGVLGIVLGLVIDPRRYRYAALMTVLPVLAYSIFQPTLRYRYIVLGLLVFLSFDLVGRLIVMITRKSGLAIRSGGDAPLEAR